MDYDDSILIEEAKEKIHLFEYRIKEIQERNIQVFILCNRHEVNFRKVSDGGLYGSKKHFKKFKN